MRKRRLITLHLRDTIDNMEQDLSNYNAPRRGGRPSQLQASQIHERILDIATDLFLTEGYGDTSIEAIAKRAGISKRTFYHRFDDKADLFGAIVYRLITRLRPADTAPLFKDGPLEEVLQRLAKVILRAALSSEALSLHRLIISEARRFPELAIIMDTEGSRREAIKHIADLLKHQTHLKNASFAAEQFLQMVVSVPQRRALGLGTAMTGAELDAWACNAVHLFLNGCR
jgi:TetR/AcrR family transcriptional repressor of mexJK operon